MAQQTTDTYRAVQRDTRAIYNHGMSARDHLFMVGFGDRDSPVVSLGQILTTVAHCPFFDRASPPDPPEPARTPVDTYRAVQRHIGAVIHHARSAVEYLRSVDFPDSESTVQLLQQIAEIAATHSFFSETAAPISPTPNPSVHTSAHSSPSTSEHSSKETRSKDPSTVGSKADGSTKPDSSPRPSVTGKRPHPNSPHGYQRKRRRTEVGEAYTSYLSDPEIDAEETNKEDDEQSPSPSPDGDTIASELRSEDELPRSFDDDFINDYPETTPSVPSEFSAVPLESLTPARELRTSRSLYTYESHTSTYNTGGGLVSSHSTSREFSVQRRRRVSYRVPSSSTDEDSGNLDDSPSARASVRRWLQSQ
ncbi:hypothetical protein PHISCL_00153 [Aspergillus sclerotialis]|uniref:Uncharacterized protein n=1 Tax=Aspergillus sclerotialis TaxID=2070753 RepID=A0A3A3A1W1_9EURO|nr:hypothetical protein PHISCL_00153 [Aspergillus sclerotialis]